MSEPYDCIPRRISQDSRLSLEARGMLLYLLSMPTGWQIHAKQVEHATNVSSRHRRLVFQELERLGYMRQDKPHNAQGHCVGTQWKITEVANLRTSEKPSVGKMSPLENTDKKREYTEEREYIYPTTSMPQYFTEYHTVEQLNDLVALLEEVEREKEVTNGFH